MFYVIIMSTIFFYREQIPTITDGKKSGITLQLTNMSSSYSPCSTKNICNNRFLIFSSKELDGLRGDISGETMRQDEFTSQMSEQIQKVVQKALSEELAHFRLEQTKILREAVEEVLPEMEPRIYEKISGKSEVQGISPGVEVEKVSSRQRLDFPIDNS